MCNTARIRSVFHYIEIGVRTACIETITMQLTTHSVLNRDNQANTSQHSIVNFQANSPAYNWLAILLLLFFLLRQCDSSTYDWPATLSLRQYGSPELMAKPASPPSTSPPSSSPSSPPSSPPIESPGRHQASSTSFAKAEALSVTRPASPHGERPRRSAIGLKQGYLSGLHYTLLN